MKKGIGNKTILFFNEKKYHFVLSVFSMVVVLYMTVRK